MSVEISEIKKACEEFRLAGCRMEKMAEGVCERLKSVGIPCESPYFYRGVSEWFKIGNGTLYVNEEENFKKFKYLCVSVDKQYVKPIKSVMKELGIEEYPHIPAKKRR